MSFKKWNLKQYNKQAVPHLMSKYGVSELMAHLMCSRGLDDEEKINTFFSRDAELRDPFLMKDMDKAVARIKTAMENGEKICIYGDYDADGVTSTVMMYNYFYSCGADVFFYIPDRNSEGYGLNETAVRKIAENGATLILTVDNGISAHAEIDLANSLGIDVVVTDHHQPQETLPNAVAIVNPHRKDCSYPFKDFAGVGVAFKLLCALEDGMSEMMLEQFAEIVAIGTVADVVPLVDENRIIVKKGVEQMQNTENVGLYKLLEECSLIDKKITCESLAFVIAPKINAAGRLGDVNDAVKLLISEDETDSQVLCEKILSQNNSRKEIENGIMKDIEDIILQNPEKLNGRILILCGNNWHHGIIGIVSAKLMETYGKPCVLMSVEENGEVRASARSVKGFSIIDALQANSKYLTRFGGHEQAAGFSLNVQNVEEFEKDLEDYAFSNYEQMPPLTIEIDKLVSAREITLDAVKQLSMLEPFGRENEKPTFAISGAMVEGLVPLSQGKHTRLRINKDGACLNLLWFSKSTDSVPFKVGDLIDICFDCEVGEYNGAEQLTLKVKDARIHGIKQDALLTSRTLYNDVMKNKTSPLATDAPTREEIGAIYTFLKQNGGYKHSCIALYSHFINKFSFAKTMFALEILKQLNLIKANLHSEQMNVEIIPQTEKTDLSKSELFCRCQKTLQENSLCKNFLKV